VDGPRLHRPVAARLERVACLGELRQGVVAVASEQVGAAERPQDVADPALVTDVAEDGQALPNTKASLIRRIVSR
jgi:hypothetical protein